MSGSNEVSNKGSTANSFNGCFDSGTCYRTEYECSVSVQQNGDTIQLETNSIADHNLWVNSNMGYVEEDDIRVQFPAVPTLLSMQESLNQPSQIDGMGFAVNGVTLRNPYNSNTCCDATFARAPAQDYCNGDSNGGRYTYSFLAHDTSNNGEFGNCPMACSSSGASDLVGVALDGFPIYGAMQYYSPSDSMIYIDPFTNGCNDCELKQLNGDDTDTCGGIKVADGSAIDGTHYRYIVTASFPFYFQCYRGDLGNTGIYNSDTSSFESIVLDNDCDVNDLGHDEECTALTQSYAEGNLCTLGNCFIDGEDLSAAYFTCSDTITVAVADECWDGVSATTTTQSTTSTTSTTIDTTTTGKPYNRALGWNIFDIFLILRS